METALENLRTRINERIATEVKKGVTVCKLSASAEGGILGIAYDVEGADSFEVKVKASTIANEEIGRFLEKVTPKSMNPPEVSNKKSPIPHST